MNEMALVPFDLRLFTSIASKAQWQPGMVKVAVVSRRDLSIDMGCYYTTICKSLARLIYAGWLRRIPQVGAGRDQRSVEIIGAKEVQAVGPIAAPVESPVALYRLRPSITEVAAKTRRPYREVIAELAAAGLLHTAEAAHG